MEHQVQHQEDILPEVAEEEVMLMLQEQLADQVAVEQVADHHQKEHQVRVIQEAAEVEEDIQAMLKIKVVLAAQV